jgi:hypothetical protein
MHFILIFIVKTKIAPRYSPAMPAGKEGVQNNLMEG